MLEIARKLRAAAAYLHLAAAAYERGRKAETRENIHRTLDLLAPVQDYLKGDY